MREPLWRRPSPSDSVEEMKRLRGSWVVPVRGAVGLAVALVFLLAAGCSTIHWERLAFDAGQEHRRRQWELEEGRPSVGWTRPEFGSYQEARRARLGEDARP